MGRHETARARTTRQTRRCVAALLVALACTAEERPAEPVTAPTPEAGPVAVESGPLAVLAGTPITAAAFAAHLDVARAPGYRPATRDEAARLLRAQLELLALDRELDRRGHVPSTATRRAALSAIASERGLHGDRAVLEALLAEAGYSVDHARLARFVSPRLASSPPRPPGAEGALR